MIPLTVSFFTKGNKNKAKGKRDAFIYGFFILLIFVLLSIPFHIIDGISGNIFNQISTNIWLNLFFFAIFLFFALSFFGYYEITLPSSIANKSSKAEEAGGLIGIFFMALTLVMSTIR
jgi:thiol:disulfide interchange protein DsbD